MKKIFTLFAATVCGLAMNAKTLYLHPNDDWKKDGARFAIYAFDDSKSLNVWYDMIAVSGNDGYYQAAVDDKYPQVIFCRMNPNARDNNWDNKWNQTQDMTIESDKNLCEIGGWDQAGSWSVYNAGGGDQPGGGGGTPIQGEHDYYLMGNVDGTESGNIVVPTPEELFECGKLTYSFPGHAENENRGYFFVMVCDPGQVVGVGYMLKAYSTESHATLYSQQEETGANQKLAVPGPTATFYLYDNGDGTLELSTVELEGKTLVGGCEDQAIEETIVTEKARKQIIDGQLRIIRGDKIFDATGRQL